jgi:integrase
VHQGRRISACALREELARAADTAGLGKITPHALRHAFATALEMGRIASGASFGKIRELILPATSIFGLDQGRLAFPSSHTS